MVIQAVSGWFSIRIRLLWIIKNTKNRLMELDPFLIVWSFYSLHLQSILQQDIFIVFPTRTAARTACVIIHAHKYING